jgi:UDP-N-acetylglucosamine--N-acetylmuramyl-(pentapeptide) pyrophosphoryl-undecaprenol N-acetylglucosamine transferase
MDSKATKIKILLSGGGTAGSVSPLLAISDTLSRDDYDFVWLGTKKGPEEEMVKVAGIKFFPIASGKWRRYFSWENLTDFFRLTKGFFDSLLVIRKFKPDLMISAGGFVSVPVAFAGKLMRVPILIHQQDVRPGLANKIMAPLADIITVTFKKSLGDYGKKAIWVGNPVRHEFEENRIDRRTALQKLGIGMNMPILLVMGGGTGSLKINELVHESVQELMNFCQVIHITGKNKSLESSQISSRNQNYQSFEFLNTEGMLKVFTVADAIVSRAGMNALTEISYFKIPAILIPMPDSHQEENAKIFEENEAAIVLDQKKLDKDDFIKNISRILTETNLQAKLIRNLSGVIRICEEGEFEEIIEKMVR